MKDHITASGPGGFLVVGGSAPATAPGAGLHCVHYDGGGALGPRHVIPADHPSYAAADPARGTLHTVVEREAGQIVSLRLDPGLGIRGTLATAPSGGGLPCHIAVHPSGSHVFAAHYGDGVLSVFPVGADGAIMGSAPGQTVRHPARAVTGDLLPGPHAHMAAPSPDGRFVLCTDLGTDRVYVYAFDAVTGRLTPHHTAQLPPGRGPRHLTFHPAAPYAYLLNELSSTLAICTWHAPSGRIQPITELPTRHDPDAPHANHPAAVRLAPDGRFLYASNRGDDTIAVYAVQEGGAALDLITTVPCGGTWPRDIALAPGGHLLFCANQRSDTVTVFHRDASSGHLTPAGPPLTLTAPTSVLPIGSWEEGAEKPSMPAST